MMSKLVEFKPLEEMESKSKEGLCSGEPDDSWLHGDLDDSFIHEINKNHRTIKKSELILDLSKANAPKTGRRLNTAKLVKRPVQVRGKDGKIHTRMQWVDPNKGMVQPDDGAQGEQEEVSQVDPNLADKVDTSDYTLEVEATKKKVYDLSTMEGQVEKYVDDLSKEEKEVLLRKYELTWKHNAHPSIDWKNAIVALKEHLKENPHLAGATHLPKEKDTRGNGVSTKTPEGTENENDYCNRVGIDECYRLMKEYNLYDGEDPRTDPKHAPKSEGGDGMGGMIHLRNMRALKAYLKENPHLMTDAPPVMGSMETTTNTEPTLAQKGGNTVEGILNNMSDLDKYELCKKLGITDYDPRLDPEKVMNKTAPIEHMRNMMALKKKLLLDPSILNMDVEEQPTQEHEDNSNKKEIVNKKFAGLTKEAKEDMIAFYAEELKGRERSNHPSIDYMKAVTALKAHILSSEDAYDYLLSVSDEDELRNTKLPVKMVERILRQICGIKSGAIDYAVAVEKGKEWKFGISSFAMIQDDEEGNPVFSVVDTGDDGAGWDEYDVPMSQIRDFVEHYNKTKEEQRLNPVVKDKTPLHEKAPHEIEKALTENFDKNYTTQVRDVMGGVIANYWEFANHAPFVSDLCKHSMLSEDAMLRLLSKFRVPVQEPFNVIETDSDQWLSIACAKMITDTKKGEADSYVFTNQFTGEKHAYPLIESAKSWSAEEKKKARRELVGARLNMDSLKMDGVDTDITAYSLTRHIENSTAFIPFDLLSTLMVGDLKFSIEAEGNGCNYGQEDNTVTLSRGYIMDNNLNSRDSSFNLAPHGCHRITDSVAHEVAHALDSFFSDGSGYANWEGNKNTKKFVNKNYSNCIPKSYFGKVDKSNPNRHVIMDDNGFLYHKDEWMSAYEGRIYGVDPTELPSDDELNVYDPSTGFDRLNDVGCVEHWSENVARYANAFHAFKEWVGQDYRRKDAIITMDEWAEKMYHEFSDMGYGDDYTRDKSKADKERKKNKKQPVDEEGNPIEGTGYDIPVKDITSYTDGYNGESSAYQPMDDNPIQAYGYLYHVMKQRYPHLSRAIHSIFNRGDFMTSSKEPKGETPKQRADNHDFARKSEPTLVLEV